MNSISITIPMAYDALTRAGNMLHDLASDIDKEVITPTPVPAAVAETPVAPVVPIALAAAETPATPAVAETPAIPAAPAGVEVDSSGLPWDPRINSSSKKKLAKTLEWKLARGVDPVLVEQVKVELRAAMAAPVPAATETPVAPAPAIAETPAVPVEAIAPIPVATPTLPAVPAPMTFQQLLARITAEGIPADKVTTAVINVGLASMPLLGARPDLVPAVAAELFPVV